MACDSAISRLNTFYCQSGGIEISLFNIFDFCQTDIYRNINICRLNGK